MSDALKFAINVPFQQFHKAAIAAIRAKCRQVKDFEEGAIGALYVPAHPDAFRWLGLPVPEEGTQDSANDNSYVIRVESVVKGGSMIRAAGWRHLPELEPVDSGAFVMQKMFACLRAIRTANGFASDKLSNVLTIEGQYNGKGAVGYNIIPCKRSDDSLEAMGAGLIVIYGVSGATGIEDEWCAFGSSRPVLANINGASQGLEVFYDGAYNPEKVVQEGKISFWPTPAAITDTPQAPSVQSHTQPQRASSAITAQQRLQDKLREKF